MVCRFGEFRRVFLLALAGFLVLAPMSAARATTSDAAPAAPADDTKKDAQDPKTKAKKTKKPQTTQAGAAAAPAAPAAQGASAKTPATTTPKAQQGAGEKKVNTFEDIVADAEKRAP
jgi:hypothetical protein